MDNHFQEFQWKGINKQGKRLSGVIRAAGIKTVESELQSKEIEVIQIELKAPSILSRWQKKVKASDIVFFTRYLSTMLSAGMPILKALDIISQDPANKVMQSVVTSIRNEVAIGKTLSDSFAKYPRYFSVLYCNLVKAGEKSGTLDKILKRLAGYLEKTENLKRKIKKALIYPCAIVSVSLLVSFILLFFVMPQFETMFKSYGMKLPLFTRIVISFSNFLRAYWWVFLLMIIGAVWGIRALLKNKQLARLKDIWILKIYIFGPMLQKAIIARFTSTLAITIDAGLPIIEALQSMVNIMGNRVYSEGITEIYQGIIKGNSLSTTMSETNLFPHMVIQMVAVGEVSGALPEMLNSIALYYEETVNAIVDSISALLEPLIMVILGIIIGSFVIAMYLPIFKLGSLF